MKNMKALVLSLCLSFILGSSGGYIALWEAGNPTPLRVFPYKVETLPPADQQALKGGIHLEDDSALIRLLEDYLS